MNETSTPAYKTCENYSSIDTNNTRWHYSCDEQFGLATDFFLLILVILSNLLLLWLTVRVNRKSWSCCWGRPAIIFPLNMLDGYDNRLAYGAAFGSMTFELSSVLWNPYSRFTSFGIGYAIKDDPVISQYPTLRVLLLFVQIAICTFMFYPLFFSLSTKYKFVGAIIGLINALYRLGAWFWLASCLDIQHDILSQGFTVKKYMLPLLIWPCLVCMAILLSQYIMIIVKCIQQRQFGMDLTPEPIALDHHKEHVRCLLADDPLPWREESLNHVSIFNRRKFMQNFGLRRVPGFKFPTRVIATFVVTVLSVYQIGIQVAFTVFSYLKALRRIVKCFLLHLSPEFYSFTKYVIPYLDYIYNYFNIAANLWVILLVFDGLLALGYVYHICLCYRKHMLRVYKGDRRIFPVGWSRESNPYILTAASRHAGLQIAYTIWGFVIIHVTVYLVLIFIIFIIIIPPRDFQYWRIIDILSQTVVFAVLLNAALIGFHWCMNRFLCMQPKAEPQDAKIPLAIDNRRAWYNMSFFFFFWNLFLGVASALMRGLQSLFVGVFLIPRIDRPILMRGLETYDNGFYAYLCLLDVNNAHDHPVVKCFVNILVDRLEENRRELNLNEISEDTLGLRADPVLSVNGRRLRNSYHGSKRARYYWFVAYTLILNPSLKPLRKVVVDQGDGYDSERDQRGYGSVSKHKVVRATQTKNRGASDLHSDCLSTAPEVTLRGEIDIGNLA